MKKQFTHSVPATTRSAIAIARFSLRENSTPASP
jgi:hypothetical protein